jgi:hypothetical protein
MLAGVTLHNFLVIGLMASVFIVLFKAAVTRVSAAPQGLKSFAGAI